MNATLSTVPTIEPASTSGRGWAYTGAISGGLVSIAANIAHSFIAPHGASTQWSPDPGAVVGAIVWPVFLFIAVEILARVAWPHGLTWQLLRWGGMLPVALVAALVSYRHLSGLLAHYGEEKIVYLLGPIAVDGLMVMATGALLATRPHRITAIASQPSAINDHAVPAMPAAPAIAVPPLSTVDSAPTVPAPTPAPVKAEVPTPAELAARITAKPATNHPASTVPATGRTASTPRPRTSPIDPAPSLTAPATDIPVPEPGAAQLSLPILDPDLVRRARLVARQYLTENGVPINAGQLARRLHVSSSEASQALAVLNLDTDNPTQPIMTVNGNRPAGATR
jgi:hypothetical protein